MMCAGLFGYWPGAGAGQYKAARKDVAMEFMIDGVKLTQAQAEKVAKMLSDSKKGPFGEHYLRGSSPLVRVNSDAFLSAVHIEAHPKYIHNADDIDHFIEILQGCKAWIKNGGK